MKVRWEDFEKVENKRENEVETTEVEVAELGRLIPLMIEFLDEKLKDFEIQFKIIQKKYETGNHPAIDILDEFTSLAHTFDFEILESQLSKYKTEERLKDIIVDRFSKHEIYAIPLIFSLFINYINSTAREFSQYRTNISDLVLKKFIEIKDSQAKLAKELGLPDTSLSKLNKYMDIMISILRNRVAKVFPNTEP